MGTPTLRIKSCLAVTCLSFVGMVLLCNILDPTIRWNNYGISAYGAQPITSIPYYAGFAAVIICLAIIFWQLYRVDSGYSVLSLAFIIAASCLVGIAATSYSQSSTVFTIHSVFCAVLVLSQLLTGAWILRHAAKSLDILLYTIFILMLFLSEKPSIDLPILSLFFVRETIIFVCVTALLGRAALRRLAITGTSSNI